MPKKKINNTYFRLLISFFFLCQYLYNRTRADEISYEHSMFFIRDWTKNECYISLKCEWKRMKWINFGHHNHTYTNQEERERVREMCACVCVKNPSPSLCVCVWVCIWRKSVRENTKSQICRNAACVNTQSKQLTCGGGTTHQLSCLYTKQSTNELNEHCEPHRLLVCVCVSYCRVRTVNSEQYFLVGNHAKACKRVGMKKANYLKKKISIRDWFYFRKKSGVKLYHKQSRFICIYSIIQFVSSMCLNLKKKMWNYDDDKKISYVQFNLKT